MLGSPAGNRRFVTAQPNPAGHREPLPTVRGRQTQAAIDTAARAVIARKGILATTISDIAAEANRSTASFYNYYDSKEAMVREWAMRFRDEATERAKAVTRHGLTNRERAYQAAAAHWHTYRHRLAEMISVSQLAMVNADFAEFWAQLCAIPISFITDMVRRAQADGYCAGDDPHLIAVAIVSMFNQFCYVQLSGDKPSVDDDACITTLAHIFYRAIYCRKGA
jgi:AcrR family transcriptional regulator